MLTALKSYCDTLSQERRHFLKRYRPVEGGRFGIGNNGGMLLLVLHRAFITSTVDLLLTHQSSVKIITAPSIDGFRYENRHYSSLSAIAVAISGNRWNGLAFFGLTRSTGGKRKERSHAAE